jgi:hypothetical protein
MIAFTIYYQGGSYKEYHQKKIKYPHSNTNNTMDLPPIFTDGVERGWIVHNNILTRNTIRPMQLFSRVKRRTGLPLQDIVRKSPTDPFPLHLRQVIEPQIIEKFRIFIGREALDAIRCATGESAVEAIMARFKQRLALENRFSYIPQDTKYYLVAALLQSAGLSRPPPRSLPYSRNIGPNA